MNADSVSVTPAALSRWYDAHPDVRRLHAVSRSGELHVTVSLEPTIDNSDVLVAWFVNGRTWIRELQSVSSVVVRLHLADATAGEAGDALVEGVTIAALDWRDPAIPY